MADWRAGRMPDVDIRRITPQKVGLLSSALPSPVGDVVGLLADGAGYAQNPESFTVGRGLLSLAALAPGVPRMNLWHGSKNKFDKFDLKQVGAGSGQQAYGHGVYLAEHKGVAEGFAGPKGHLYQVDVAAETVDKMLDWDVPIMDQPEAVRAAVMRLVGSFEPGTKFRTQGDLEGFLRNADGRSIHKWLDGITQGKKTNDIFRKNGIPGIKYVAEGPIGGLETTRNFVVFDPKDAHIVKP